MTIGLILQAALVAAGIGLQSIRHGRVEAEVSVTSVSSRQQSG